MNSHADPARFVPIDLVRRGRFRWGMYLEYLTPWSWCVRVVGSPSFEGFRVQFISGRRVACLPTRWLCWPPPTFGPEAQRHY